ncbi:hypothetical protein D3C72_600370 [compost metagenome]
MIYDLDARKNVTKMMELMQFDLPFTGVMPDEFEYRANDVRFVYSDLGISADKLRKLLDLKVRHNGIERKFAYVTVSVEGTGEWEFDTATETNVEVTIKHTVAVFE